MVRLFTDGDLLNWRDLLLLEPGDTDREQIAIAALIDDFVHSHPGRHAHWRGASERS